MDLVDVKESIYLILWAWSLDSGVFLMFYYNNTLPSTKFDAVSTYSKLLLIFGIFDLSLTSCP